MILVVGGAYQGKREFIKQRWNIREEAITDCAQVSAEAITDRAQVSAEAIPGCAQVSAEEIPGCAQLWPADPTQEQSAGPEQVKHAASGQEQSAAAGYPQDAAHGRIYTDRTMRAIVNYQEEIRYRTSRGEDPEKTLSDLVQRVPDLILCANEIGMGIVPMDRSERDYREAAGRTLCMAARMADEVWRVICGIGERIK